MYSTQLLLMANPSVFNSAQQKKIIEQNHSLILSCMDELVSESSSPDRKKKKTADLEQIIISHFKIQSLEFYKELVILCEHDKSALASIEYLRKDLVLAKVKLLEYLENPIKAQSKYKNQMATRLQLERVHLLPLLEG